MPARADARRRVLLVDDQRVNRLVLGSMLRNTFEVVEAANGADAVRIALSGAVDLVLMDIRMPVIDGCEATRIIKESLGETFLPIVLMTASDDEKFLAEALEAGGDEVLTKPLSPLVVDRRLRALLRFSDTFREVKTQKDQLGHFREAAERDYALAGRIFDSVQQQGCLFLPSIHVSSTPMEAFSGDIAMAAMVAPTKVRVFLGDFTGHGLAAAVGVIPVSEVFYATARSDLPMDLVLAQMNEKVLSTLPRGMFLAAFMAELDASTGRLVMWNGGIPSALVLSEGGVIRRRIESAGIPLGIVPHDQFQVELDRGRLEIGERLFIYSDGVVEASDPAGELFGTSRLEEAVTQCPDADGSQAGYAARAVERALHRFHGGAPQQDDITIIELQRDLHLDRDIKRLVRRGAVVPSDARLRLEMFFEEAELREAEPLAALRALLQKHPLLTEDYVFVDTVLSELFGNALDHGLLALNSSLKDGPSGFERYHAARKRALEGLEHGRIAVAIEVSPGGRPELTLRVQDSGPGFSVSNDLPVLPAPIPGGELLTHGRGLTIVRGLCSRLEFFDAGRAVRATMRLRGGTLEAPKSPSGG